MSHNMRSKPLPYSQPFAATGHRPLAGFRAGAGHCTGRERERERGRTAPAPSPKQSKAKRERGREGERARGRERGE